jgi:predicted ATPase
MSHEERTSAMECVNEALTVARRQSAVAWELRATMLLAGLLSADGRRDQARQVLAHIYARFTEGFETADLLTARRLIEDLS